MSVGPEEIRSLLYQDKFSRGEPSAQNLLIHGDNLAALKALKRRFSEQVKCVYIDPPYNSGNIFAQYNDSLEHSLWLGFMRPRLELIRDLMAEDGILFVSIDDDEMAYLKVLCDEIFGRKNFCGTLIWEKKKKPAFLSKMGSVTEYILAYAKNKERAPNFVYGETTANKKYPLNNAGNGLRVLNFPAGSVEFNIADQVIEAQEMSEGNIVTRLIDAVQIVSHRNIKAFRLEGEWRYSQQRLDEILASGERIVISKIPFRPNHIKPGGAPKKIKNLLSIEHFDIPTYEDATAESRALFGSEAFSYPKPEKLIAILIEAVTHRGDYVLDSFLGSGTTAAVAHKLGRHWIGIEQGDHYITHCVPRLNRVVDGTDGVGISGEIDWRGGGEFACFELDVNLVL